MLGEVEAEMGPLFDRVIKRRNNLGLKTDPSTVIEVALGDHLDDLNGRLGSCFDDSPRLQRLIHSFYGEEAIEEVVEGVIRKNPDDEIQLTARNKFIILGNTIDALARIQQYADRGDAFPPTNAPLRTTVTIDDEIVAARVPVLIEESKPIELQYNDVVRETADILQERFTPREYDQSVYDSRDDLGIGGRIETYLVLKTDRTVRHSVENSHVFAPSNDPEIDNDSRC